tara:strand:- start:1813 stop:1989 length:177 start_codon:yes stop_codon:yes gene_type:complete
VQRARLNITDRLAERMGVTDDVIEDTKQKQFILCAVQSDGTVTKVLVDSNGKIQTVSS